MTDISGIYAIVNTVNGKAYVGSSNRINRRVAAHRRRLNLSNHFNPHLQRAWNLYGEDVFEFEVLELVSVKELRRREYFWIQKMKACNSSFGYNIQPNPADYSEVSEETRRKIGDANRGRVSPLRGKKHSKEHRQKNSLSHKGKTHSEESKRKMSESRKGKTSPLKGRPSPLKGKPLPEEHKRKIGDANKGKVRSEEQNQRNSEARKGKPLPEEHKRNISEAHKGKPLSEEHRRRISEGKKGKPSSLKGRKMSPFSEERRRKIGEATRKRPGHWRGKCLSGEHKQKISEGMKRYYAHQRAEQPKAE